MKIFMVGPQTKLLFIRFYGGRSSRRKGDFNGGFKISRTDGGSLS